MPRWVLGCPDCNKDFTHSEIKLTAKPPDPFMWLGDKPEFPVGGLSLLSQLQDGFHVPAASARMRCDLTEPGRRSALSADEKSAFYSMP